MKFRIGIFGFFSSFLVPLTIGLAVFSGCAKHTSRTASFGSSENLLAYGVYSAQNQDANGLSTKLSLNQNGTYSRKKFKSACLLAETRGQWKSDHESLEFRLSEIRKRNDCSTEDWQEDKVEKTTILSLRNVTTNSFEILDQEEEVSAHWVRFNKR